MIVAAIATTIIQDLGWYADKFLGLDKNSCR